MRIHPSIPRLLAAGSACLLCLLPAAPSAADQPPAPGVTLQAPSLLGAEPYHLTVTVGAAPASASDAVLVLHSADPKLQVSTDFEPLDTRSTVTDAQGTTVTVKLANAYAPVSAGEVFTRRLQMYQWNASTPVTVTAEVVDEKTGRVESSSAPSTVSEVILTTAGQWQAKNGPQGYNADTMPLGEQTRTNSYGLMFGVDASPALPAASPTFTFSAATLKAAGYTAQQLSRALEVQAEAGDAYYGQHDLNPVVGSDGSLTWTLPAVDLPPAHGGRPSVEQWWQLSLYATCALPPGAITGVMQLHAADGTILGGLSQTFSIQRHNCLTHDFTGDGKPDLLARDRAGVLWLYPGTGRADAPYGRRIRVGGGWGGYTSLVAVGDATGDGHDDLVARDRAGRLWLYRGTGQVSRPFLSRVPVQEHGYRLSPNLVADGALTGDGEADLVDAGAPGRVFFGTGHETDPFSDMVGSPPAIGSYNAVTGAGVLDWLPWFAARDRRGALWLVGDQYLGTPAPAPIRVGGGWQIYNTIAQAGDTSSTGRTDLVARDGAGRLWLYAGTGDSSRPFRARTLIGGGWQIYDLLA